MLGLLIATDQSFSYVAQVHASALGPRIVANNRASGLQRAAQLAACKTLEIEQEWSGCVLVTQDQWHQQHVCSLLLVRAITRMALL